MYNLIDNLTHLNTLEHSSPASVQVKTLAVDFTDGLSIYEKLQNELDQLEIGILVHNVGMAPGFGDPFVEIKSNHVVDVINW